MSLYTLVSHHIGFVPVTDQKEKELDREDSETISFQPYTNFADWYWIPPFNILTWSWFDVSLQERYEIGF